MSLQRWRLDLPDSILIGGRYLFARATPCGHDRVGWRTSRDLPCLGLDKGGVTLCCSTCGEIQTLGPSSDKPSTVQHELRAARVAQWIREGEPAITVLSAAGYGGYQFGFETYNDHNRNVGALVATILGDA